MLFLYLFYFIYLFFSQEGWRLEHANAQNPNSPIIFKGVVFNEMKGVFVSIILTLSFGLISLFNGISTFRGYWMPMKKSGGNQ